MERQPWPCLSWPTTRQLLSICWARKQTHTLRTCRDWTPVTMQLKTASSVSTISLWAVQNIIERDLLAAKMRMNNITRLLPIWSSRETIRHLLTWWMWMNRRVGTPLRTMSQIWTRRSMTCSCPASVMLSSMRTRRGRRSRSKHSLERTLLPTTITSWIQIWKVSFIDHSYLINIGFDND